MEKCFYWGLTFNINQSETKIFEKLKLVFYTNRILHLEGTLCLLTLFLSRNRKDLILAERSDIFIYNIYYIYNIIYIPM